jgi:ATP-dependent Clp protease ATP-binding subunit ClpA
MGREIQAGLARPHAPADGGRAERTLKHRLESQLAEKKVDVTFSDKLRKFLAKKGFDPLMGARPMQRLIQDTIRRALADELLFGRLVDGGRLSVDLDDKEEVQLDIQPLPKKEGRAKPEAEEAAAG